MKKIQITDNCFDDLLEINESVFDGRVTPDIIVDWLLIQIELPERSEYVSTGD